MRSDGNLGLPIGCSHRPCSVLTVVVGDKRTLDRAMAVGTNAQLYRDGRQHGDRGVDQ